MTTCRTYNRAKDFWDYCWKLEERGAELLNCGAYSRVFKHPKKKNVVIKVAVIEYGRPDGWFHYAKFLIDNKIKSPHAPKIYTLIRYRNMYVATMEQLKPFKTSNRQHVSTLRAMTRGLATGRPIRSKNLRLKSFIKKLNSYKPFGKLDLDLHYDNVMVRRSVLVLTDPFCGEMRVK